MFERREVEGAGRAPAFCLDVVGLVAADGHALHRQVGDAHQQVAQGGVLGLGLVFERGDGGLAVGDKGAQAVEFGVVAAGLGGAHVPGGGVGLCLGVLGGLDFRAAGLVEGQDFQRHRRQPATGQARIESGRVFANATDIMHGAGP